MGISDENKMYADTGCIVMKVLLGIIAVAIFPLTPAISFANPDTRYRVLLNQYEAARNGLSASKGAQRYMGKRAPSLYRYYAAAGTSSKKSLVDEGLEKSDKFQKLLKERNARIEAEEQRKWNNLSPEEKLETQREIRRKWEKKRADDTIKLLKADEAKKKAEADKKKAAKRKVKADGRKAERECRNDRLKARSEWLRAKRKEDEAKAMLKAWKAKGVDSNLGKDGDDSGIIRTSDFIESSPSITDIKNSEINTNKIDGGGAPNEKGMKYALDANVTDNVMNNIYSQTSSETNSAQNDMGTVRDERGNSAQSDHARGMERIKAQGRQVDKAIATGSDQHTSAQASTQTSRAESDVIGGAIGRGILEGGSQNQLATARLQACLAIVMARMIGTTPTKKGQGVLILTRKIMITPR